MTLLVDGNNLMFREMNNAGKSNVHPVRSLYNDLSTNNDLTVLVWDGYNGNERRKALYPEYKGNRPEKGEDVYAIFKLFQELMEHTTVMQIKVPTWEADDVIFTLAKFFSSQGDDNIIVNTNDADYLQFADLPGVSLPCVTKWAWDSHLIITYKALVGDTSDNIGGMQGFGEGAWNQMRTYHDVMMEALSTNNWDLWNTIPFPKYCQKHCCNRDNFDRSVMFYKVITMQDVPIEEIMANQKMGTKNPLMVEQIFSRYML
jgi:5'-3' exonuclease